MTQLTDYLKQLACGVTFDIERTEGGYIPSEWTSPQSGNRKMFAEPRLLGFSEIIKTRLAPHLALIGGDELRYIEENPPVSEPVEIRNMLIERFGFDKTSVSAHRSKSNTQGNVGIMHELMIKRGLRSSEVIWVTSHYHVPRLQLMLDMRGEQIETGGTENVLRGIKVIPAEAIYLYGARDEDGRKCRQDQLHKFLDGGYLADQIVSECNGIADLYSGTYKPFANFDPR